MSASPRASLAEVRRIVVKIGSRSLMADPDRFRQIADQVHAQRQAGRSMVLVSSGAVAMGRKRLGIAQRPKAIDLLQAAAAAGQSLLMRAYETTQMHMVLSPEIMAEYEGVLNRPKFRLPKWVVQDLLAYIRASAEWVTPDGEESSVARDPSDDKFLFAAASGGANWLVSADPDLLELREFRDIPIVPPWEFLSLLES